MAIHRLFSASPTEIHRHRSRDKGERLLPTEFVCGACLSFHLSFPGPSGKFLYAQVVVVLQMVTPTVDAVYQLQIDLGSRLPLVRSQHEHEIGCCPPETTQESIRVGISYFNYTFSPVSCSVFDAETLHNCGEAAGQSQGSSGFSRAEHDHAGPPCCPRLNGLSSCLSAGSI